MTIQRLVEGSSASILKLEGKLDDMSAAQLQKTILGVLQEGVTRLVLDMEKVSYMGGAGLRVLMIGKKTAQSKQAVLDIINVPGTIRPLLQSAGIR